MPDTHDRPFVDRRVVDLAAAERVARAASARWEFRPPVLLRQGMNAIFECGDVVLRVGRASAPAAASHELAMTLRSRNIPALAPIDRCAIDLDGFAVSAWERIRPTDTTVDWRAVGAVVASVHALDRSEVPPAYPLPSPTAFPWWDFASLLDEVRDRIDEQARAGLEATIDEHADWSDRISEGAVVCHGDVHPGNVLMGPDGPVLIDWDLLCLAPPGWDHAMLTTFAERWGGDPGVYAAFADGYGGSLAADGFTHSIAALRNVAATLMRVRAGITDPAAKAEADRRLRYWRGEADAPVWRAQ